MYEEGPASAAYFMYKFRSFKAEQVNKLEMPGTEIARNITM